MNLLHRLAKRLSENIQVSVRQHYGQVIKASAHYKVYTK